MGMCEINDVINEQDIRRTKMINQRKTKILILLPVMVMVALSGTNLFSIIYYNGIENAFDEPPQTAYFPVMDGSNPFLLAVGYLAYPAPVPGAVNITKTKSIGEYNAYGASYVFKSNAELNLFFSEVEKAVLEPPDYEALKKDINAAIENMGKAVKEYSGLKEKAEATRYNKEFIEKLKTFNYGKYEGQSNLRKDMFQRVTNSMAKGEIREMSKAILAECEYILKKSIEIEKIIGSGDVDISDLREDAWLLMSHCMDSIAAGKYAAQVFFEIKKTTTKQF